ncbi:MAG: T9SS type A sorting domain-containing protein [bacterium]|nr:T9SS type A sorting domain-containing protein [bacterium]
MRFVKKVKLLLVFSFLLILPSILYAQTIDAIGMTSSLGVSDNVVAVGDTVFIRFRLDDVTGITELVTLAGTSASLTQSDTVQVRYFSSSTPNASFALTATSTQTKRRFTVTDTDLSNRTVTGYFLLPTIVPTGTQSIQIRGSVVYINEDFDYVATAWRASSISWGTASAVSAFGSGIYTNSYMSVQLLSAAPTLHIPSASFQNGRDNNTIRVRYTLPVNAVDNEVKLQIRTGGGTVLHEIVFNEETAGSYSRDLTYTPGGAGSFTATGSADPGDNTFSIASQTNNTALVDGSTYTVRIYTKETGKASNYAEFTSFVYDITAATPTLNLPSSAFQQGRDDDTIKVRFNIPETASSSGNRITLEFRSGGTAHQTIVFSNTASGWYSGLLRYYSNSFSVVPSSNDVGDALFTIHSQSNTTALVNGSTYTVRLYYDDIVGNTSSNVDFASFVYDVSTVAPSLTSPSNGSYVPAGTQIFTWTNVEPYQSVVITFERTGDNHTLTITPGSSYLTSGSKSLTLNLTSISGTSDYSYSGDGALDAGQTYTWKITVNDLPANGTEFSSRTIHVSTGNVLNVTGTLVAAWVGASQTNAPIYRLNLSASHGTAMLTGVTFDMDGDGVNFFTTADNTDITAVKLWISNDATFGGDTQIGSTASFTTPAAISFSFSAQAITTTPRYLFLTINTSSTASDLDQVYTSVNSASSFTFSSSTSAAGSFPLPYVNTALPVELESFVGGSRNGTVTLQWVTASETNNAGFEIYRSSNNSDYIKIASFLTNPELRSQAEGGTSSEGFVYEFVDRNVSMGQTYSYRLRSIDIDGSGFTFGRTVEVYVNELPNKFELKPNYPNPFNSITNIRFDLPTISKVTIRIYDLNGREVRNLLENELQPGSHILSWDGKNAQGQALASGTYIVKMQAGKFEASRKILLLK